MSLTHHYGLTEEVLSYKAPHPPVEEFEPAKDRAFFADPEKKTLLSAATRVKHLTPYIGTELFGVQLNKLSPEQRDELALLAAEARRTAKPMEPTVANALPSVELYSSESRTLI